VAPPTPRKYLLGQPGGDEELDRLARAVEILGQAGIPFTTTPPADVVRPAPRLGAHTADVAADPREPRSPAGGDRLRWPLEGLRVVDFGMYLAGPIAPMMLADLGADVIKVEPPTGDQMRFVERTFSGCQRGKRGMAVDFKHPASRPVRVRRFRPRTRAP